MEHSFNFYWGSSHGIKKDRVIQRFSEIWVYVKYTLEWLPFRQRYEILLRKAKCRLHRRTYRRTNFLKESDQWQISRNKCILRYCTRTNDHFHWGKIYEDDSPFFGLRILCLGSLSCCL
jgi:hypothetical protein